jgi:hypothetical protein
MAMGRGNGIDGAWLGIALGIVLLAPATAVADGERTPMIGGAVVGAAANEDAFAGAQLEAAWWHWRLGFAAEGSMMWSGDDAARRVTVLGLSTRLLVFDTLVQSLLEPRDVELGLELQGIVERAWWTSDGPQVDPTRYGVGVALRLRGGGEYDLSSLLAESRVFVRVMTSRPLETDAIARTVMPPRERDTAQLTVMIGLGAAWGSGDPDYLERFRMEPFSPAAQRLAGGWFQER